MEQEKSMTTTIDADRSISPLSTKKMRLIGEAQQQWAIFRRKYNLFTFRRNNLTTEWLGNFPPSPIETANSDQSNANDVESQHTDSTLKQFAYINEPFLSWNFTLLSEKGEVVGSVNRNFTGLARETFTDTGMYVLRMDAAGIEAESKHLISHTERKTEAPTGHNRGMTLAQRAVILATAVSIDFDYFSRKSSASGFGVFPLWFPASEASAEAAGAETVGTGIASETALASGMTSGTQEASGSPSTVTGRNIATGESASAGIGSMAGMEAARQQTYGDNNSIFNDSAIPNDQFKRVFSSGQDRKSSSGGDSHYSDEGESGHQVSGKGSFSDYLDNENKGGGGGGNRDIGGKEGSWLDWFDEL